MKQKKTFMEAMLDRHAAKEFDTSKNIDEETMDSILEVGRLSPSSFGLEHWKFIDVKNQELKQKLQEASFNQKQVGTASDVVVFVAKKKDLRANSEYVQEVFGSRVPTKEIADNLVGIHANFVKGMSEEGFDAWVKRQSFIPAANMMTYAAILGIDSSPMEGFLEGEVLKVLGLDAENYGVAIVVAFGYANDEKRPKTRLEFDQVVEVRR